MRRTIVSLGMLFALPGLAAATPAPRVLTLWHVMPASGDALGERMVKDGETILRQALLPSGLAVLEGDVSDTGREKLSVKAGTQLVEASSSAGKVYCALATQRLDTKSGGQIDNKHGTTLCLIDTDGNSRFDAMFDAAGGTGLLMVNAPIPKDTRPCDVGYAVRAPSEVKGDFWVGVRYEQYFNIYGNRMLFTDYGGRGVTASFSNFEKFPSKGPFPIVRTVMGANIAVLAAEPKGARIRVDAVMPPQPFAVVTSTTTTFIPIYH